MRTERRISDRKKTRETADLYVEDRFIKSCSITCVSPHGVFVQAELPACLGRGTRVDLYFPIDPVNMPEDKLLCLRGVIMRTAESGAGIRVYSKRLPIVPPALRGLVELVDGHLAVA